MLFQTIRPTIFEIASLLMPTHLMVPLRALCGALYVGPFDYPMIKSSLSIIGEGVGVG